MDTFRGIREVRREWFTLSDLKLQGNDSDSSNPNSIFSTCTTRIATDEVLLANSNLIYSDNMHKMKWPSRDWGGEYSIFGYWIKPSSLYYVHIRHLITPLIKIVVTATPGTTTA